MAIAIRCLNGSLLLTTSLISIKFQREQFWFRLGISHAVTFPHALAILLPKITVLIFLTPKEDNRYRFQHPVVKAWRWIRWLPWQWFTFLKYIYLGLCVDHAWGVTCGERDYHMGRWSATEEVIEELEQ